MKKNPLSIAAVQKALKPLTPKPAPVVKHDLFDEFKHVISAGSDVARQIDFLSRALTTKFGKRIHRVLSDWRGSIWSNRPHILVAYTTLMRRINPSQLVCLIENKLRPPANAKLEVNGHLQRFDLFVLCPLAAEMFCPAAKQWARAGKRIVPKMTWSKEMLLAAHAYYPKSEDIFVPLFNKHGIEITSEDVENWKKLNAISHLRTAGRAKSDSRAFARILRQYVADLRPEMRCHPNQLLVGDEFVKYHKNRLTHDDSFVRQNSAIELDRVGKLTEKDYLLVTVEQLATDRCGFFPRFKLSDDAVLKVIRGATLNLVLYYYQQFWARSGYQRKRFFAADLFKRLPIQPQFNNVIERYSCSRKPRLRKLILDILQLKLGVKLTPCRQWLFFDDGRITPGGELFLETDTLGFCTEAQRAELMAMSTKSKAA